MAEKDEVAVSDSSATKGGFFESLNRNNKKIRSDRAIAIAEDAETIYRRKVEDLRMQVKRLERDRDGMLDLSPTTADSLVLATDFDADGFAQKDLETGLKIRNTGILLEIAEARYKALFG